jgi:hypothetical protein
LNRSPLRLTVLVDFHYRELYTLLDREITKIFSRAFHRRPMKKVILPVVTSNEAVALFELPNRASDARVG